VLYSNTPIFAQISPGDGDMKDRVAIQEKLLYAYAYDSKDCASFAKLFTTDAVFNLGEPMKATGRDAILQGCLADKIVLLVISKLATT
jgi:hypothetical protein